MERTKILIVEDNPIVAEDLKIKLIHLGYEITATAYSGEQALESIKHQKPDIALMDIRLGDGMNGIDTALELKNKYNISVIYLTAHADDDTIFRAKLTEPYGYIVKPFDETELKSMIEIAVYKQKSDRKLKESEKWFKTTLNSIGDGVITTDMNGSITFMNPIAEMLTGWSRTDAADKPLEAVFNIINEITREKCENPVLKVIGTGQIIGLANHTLLISRDGKEIPIKDSGAPIILNDSDNLGVVLVFQDDTDARMAQKKIQDSENRLQSFLNNSPVGIGIWDREFRYVYINEILQKINGPSLKEHLGKTIEDVLPKAAPIIRPIFEKILSTGEPALNIELSGEVPATPGKTTHYLLSYFPIFGELETVAHIGGIIVDVTDNKNAQIRLNQQQNIFQAIIDNVPALITVYDPKAKVLHVNKSFESTVGWTNEDLKTIDIMEVCYPDPEYRTIAAEYMQKASNEWQEFSVKTKYGHSFDSIWSNVRLEDSTQIGIGIDITDKKKIEAILIKSQKMESIGKLAGGIAHDFNNILTSILGFTQISLQEVQQETELHDNLTEILASGERAKNLVKQILTFSRKGEQEKHPIHLNSLVTDNIIMMRSTIPSNIKIKENISTEKIIINANTSQMNQVLINLITNAVHAIDDNGMIDIDLELIQLDENYLDQYSGMMPGSYAKLLISDTGHGIAQENLSAIFDPYFTTKTPDKGTGLGLAVVHGIVEIHGGQIKVYSEIEKGTTFQVYLPLTTQTYKKIEDHEESNYAKGSERILFVDDEPTIAKLQKRVLERLG
jgi:two-component system, cell cycle sensor histidine kinase and response regulator CckA